MDDKWKEFFNENKEDIQEKFMLAEGHENRFENKLKQFSEVSNQKNSFNYWKVAAVLIPLVMGFAYYFIEWKPDHQKEQTVILADYSKELSQTQNQLSSLVEQKIEKVNSMKNRENKDLINKSLGDLHVLQNEYNQLLADLKESGGNTQVINSILLNLELQVNILETVMNQIQTLQEFKDKSNETYF